MQQKKEDQGVGDVVSNPDFALELLNVIAHAVIAKGGTMQHLRLIVKEPELQRRIASLVVPAGSENEYLVHVGYDMPRDKAELEAEFWEYGILDMFHGNNEWQFHPSCAGIDQTPGNRVMLLKQFSRGTSNEANIAEMVKLGYRPATHLEAYAFDKANPELQQRFWIVVLGSFVMSGGDRHVAILGSRVGARVLGSGCIDGGLGAGTRFLFVASPPKADR